MLLRSGVTGSAVSAPSLILIDRVNSVFKVNGTDYASESLATAALDPNRVISGITTVLGPVIVSGAPEMIVNGDFATGDLSGWTTTQASGGPATFSYDSGTGSLKCVVNGATQSRAEQFPQFLAGESYYIQGDLTRNGADISLLVGTESTYSFIPTIGTSQMVNGTGHKVSPFTAAISRSRIGIRENVNTGTDWHTDNVSLMLCRPVNAGWQRKHRWVVSAVAKVAPTNNEWLFCLTNNASASTTNYEYLAVYRRASDGHIIVEQQSRVGYSGSSVIFFSQDIGAVADGATFTVELRVANRIRATLNGGASQLMPASQPANYPIICIGKAFYGGTTAWTGTINSYQIDQPGAVFDSAFSIIGYGHSLIWGSQASPIMGATGASWAARLVRDNLGGAAWYNNMGRPGATSAQLRNGIVDQSDASFVDYLEHQPAYDDPRTVLVFWGAENDGDTSAIQNTRDIIAKWRSLNTAGRFIVVEPLYWSDLHNKTQADAVTAQYRADWGTNSFDLKGYVCAPTQGGQSCQGLDDAGISIGSQQPSDQSDFASGVFPASLRNNFTDSIHPGNIGGIPMANAFAQKIAALGYS